MKKTLSNILVVFLSVLIFYFGSGINVFSFCCDQCLKNVFSVERTSNSCLISHTSHQSDTQGCCANKDNEQKSCCGNENEHEGDSSSHSSNKEAGKCCSSEHISVDWKANNTFYSLFIFHITTIIFDKTAGFDFTQTPTVLYSEYFDNTPPTLPPRDYLALLEVLLI
jgi:hypothetical protein